MFSLCRTYLIYLEQFSPINFLAYLPANDDASKSIQIIVEYLTAAIKEGLDERNKNKEEKGKVEESAKG
jgi:ribosomal protein S2